MSTDEPRDPFADMLGRATAEPPADLLDRMRGVVSGAGIAGEAGGHRRRLPRAGTFALVAASLLLVVGAAVLVADQGPSDPAGPVAVDGNHLPAVWPDGFDSAVITRESEPQVEANFRSWLLSDNGTVMAQVIRSVDPSAEPSSATARPQDEADGRWTAQFSVGDASFVANGRDIGGEGRHAALLQDLLADGSELDDVVLPQGWQVVDDPDGVLTAAFTGHPRPGTRTSTANRMGPFMSDQQPQLMIMTIRTASADVSADALRLLAGPDQEPVEIVTGRWGLMVDQITADDRSVVWSPEPGVVVVVAGTGLGDDELLEVARSSRPVGATTWASYFPPELRELSDGACAALAENPRGLDSVKEQNGITQMGGSWTQVLGLDLFRLDEESLARVAEAVDADDEGYDRLAAQLNEAERRPFDTMRAVASDPARVQAERSDLDVARAAYWVVQVGRTGCGFG